MVLNTKLNVQGLDFMKKVSEIIKKVENTKGQAVLVTINSGNKVFSAGMDLKFWARNYWNQESNIVGMHHMLKEILTVNVPSLCVVNGLNIAGGVFMSLAHDKVIMNSNPKFTTCLNEAENGKVPTFAME